ncbi:unnamed protein product [Musa textilis]
MERSHARDASDLHGGSSGTNDDATASNLCIIWFLRSCFTSLSQKAATTNHYN